MAGGKLLPSVSIKLCSVIYLRLETFPLEHHLEAEWSSGIIPLNPEESFRFLEVWALESGQKLSCFVQERDQLLRKFFLSTYFFSSFFQSYSWVLETYFSKTVLMTDSIIGTILGSAWVCFFSVERIQVLFAEFLGLDFVFGSHGDMFIYGSFSF